MSSTRKFLSLSLQLLSGSCFGSVPVEFKSILAKDRCAAFLEMGAFSGTIPMRAGST